MMGRTHAATGLLGWVLVGPHVTTGWADLAVGAVVASAFAYGPDIDHGSATVTRRLAGPFHQSVGNTVGRLTGGHRGGTHTLLAVVVVGALAWLATGAWQPGLQHWLPAAVAVGWAAHLVGDALTTEGIMPLYPFLRWRIRGPFRTDHWSETIFAVAQTVATLWLGWGLVT